MSFTLLPERHANKQADPRPKEIGSIGLAVVQSQFRCTGWCCFVDLIKLVIKNIQHEQNARS